MSKKAKILWLISGLSLAILVAVRYILGGWTTDVLFVPLGIFAVSALGALVIDYKFYIEFMTLKTTKHGMNMGVLILLVLALMVAVNYFGKTYQKTWDLTEEQLHTLSDQTRSVLDGLKGEVTFTAFYRGAKDQQAKQQAKQSLGLFLDYSNKLKLKFVDAYVENEMAEKYLKGLAEADQVVMFIEYGTKSLRVEAPFNEQNVTSALIKVTRDGSKTVYFLTGHGERSLNSDEQEGLALLKQTLEDASYVVKEFKLFDTGSVPADADIVAIIGPKLQIMEGERKALLDYASRGGRLFVAADPGEKHQIAELAKEFGVEYKNNYILDIGLNRLLGRGVAGILGLVFDSANDITKKFIGREGFTIFDKVSEVSASTMEGVKLSEIVKSAQTSFVVNELQNNMKPPQARSSYSLAVVAEGKFAKPPAQKPNDKSKEESKEFSAVFFGDSDFVAQKDIVNGFNIDLAMNAIAYLAKEGDLISIAPKAPKGTELTLTSVNSNIMVVCGLLIPLFFIIFSGVMWFKRRGA